MTRLIVVMAAVLPAIPLHAAEPIAAPVDAPQATVLPIEVPAELRDHTYFVVVNGFDPLYVGKLNGFCAAIRCAGYKNVQLFALRQCTSVEREIVCIRRNDPQAKIVLLGYSLGAQVVRKACNSLACQSEFVDLLVYLGGDYLRDTEKARPENAGRIVNINGHGFAGTGGDLLFNGTEITGAANYRLDARHFGLPKRSEALEILLQAVAEINAADKK